MCLAWANRGVLSIYDCVQCSDVHHVGDVCAVNASFTSALLTHMLYKGIMSIAIAASSVLRIPEHVAAKRVTAPKRAGDPLLPRYICKVLNSIYYAFC